MIKPGDLKEKILGKGKRKELDILVRTGLRKAAWTDDPENGNTLGGRVFSYREGKN